MAKFGDGCCRGQSKNRKLLPQFYGYSHYKSKTVKIQHIYHTERKTNMPSREEMIAYITDTIQTASDLELEQYYWILMESAT